MSPTPGAHSYSGGSVVAISATAASGYQFSSWSSMGTITFDSASSSATNAHIGSDGTVTANFVAVNAGQNYQVTFVLGTGGASMSPAGAQSYAGGSSVAVSATALTGYQFSSWSSSGTISFDSASSASTNAHIGSAGTVTANFVAVNSGLHYQVVFNLGSGGASMSPAGTQTYAGGSIVSISAVAASAYQFSSWTSSGTITFDSATSASTNAHIGSAGSVTANFVAVNYQVTFVLGSGGASMTPTAGTHTYAGGSSVPLTATASSGYQFSGWAFSGPIQIANAAQSSTTATINGAGTITANFIAGSILLNTAFDSNIWDQGWQAGGNPPWYAAPGEGIGGSTAAKSDPYGSNSGPFTTDSLDTSGGTLIHITFTYKVHQTNSATDLRIAYSTKANPDLNGNSADFTYVGNLGLPGNNNQWYQGSLTIAKTATAGASITDSSAFTTHFWFRFESNLQTRTGGIVEQVWIDNVQITVS